METEPEIMFKGINRTSYLDKLIERGIAKLERVCNYIISTRVTVEQIQTRHRTDNPYRILDRNKYPRSPGYSCGTIVK